MKTRALAFSVLTASLLVASIGAAEVGSASPVPTANKGPVQPVAPIAALMKVGIGSVKYDQPSYPAPTPGNPHADKYQSGPVSFIASVHNPTNDVHTLKILFDRPAANGQGTTRIEQGVTIRPHDTQHVKLTDPDGLLNGCVDKIYNFALEDAQPNVETHVRSVALHPECIFEKHVDDPWMQAKPDNVDYTQQHYVYTSSFEMLGGAPMCGAPITTKGTVTNHSTGGAVVTNRLAVSPGQQTVVTGPAVPVGKGASKDFSLAIPSWTGERLQLWSAGTPSAYIDNRGFAVNPKKYCTLSAKTVPTP